MYPSSISLIFGLSLFITQCMMKYLNWYKKLRPFIEINVHLDIHIQYDKAGNMEYYNALLLRTVHYDGTLDSTHSAPWQDLRYCLWRLQEHLHFQNTRVNHIMS
jgi:hypothetical protein